MTTLESTAAPRPQSNSEKQPALIPAAFLIPFILITCCFALWGFANDITNPMVAAFQKIFLTGATEATWVQVAFYGGYGAMAFPAALFIRKYSYKAGILMGLFLYAIGGLLFIPASSVGEFFPFLVAYFVITCGLSFLETTANPYILSMGPAETATRRLNLAQAFNPIGSLIGMYTASQVILANLDARGKAERELLSMAELDTVKAADLAVVSQPYVMIGVVIALMFVLIAFIKMPVGKPPEARDVSLAAIFGRLRHSKSYREGVVAQMFYVGAQIMCWTFIIHYGTDVFMARGMGEKAAQVLSQQYNIVAMIIFCASRFICTFFLKFIHPGTLLMTLACGGMALSVGTIMLGGVAGLYCLVLISACMSLMFPTIYAIALKGLDGDDAKFAAAGLIMAIVGGTFLPMLQAGVIDTWSLGLVSAVQASFALPLLCFVVIATYGYRTVKFYDS
ncbi:L-fucose:H+ symporter permease [Gilvimarinus sp. 1_MG-2023]|uniref:L-fucose:H+ symporter permease n=1 Tax=Gilvimarinus sp. 1_MG-2023 TaxID=3062638 RepID=UPI0026E254E9|nr:L-fucose:H+ symporter permease [Gilvimarinus sp. 1_MG-2023]MDO6748596.1 L-fucose:H+ symporter permease [Gilvimarinus sp. 1_MG-2023]